MYCKANLSTISDIWTPKIKFFKQIQAFSRNNWVLRVKNCRNLIYSIASKKEYEMYKSSMVL